jgi:hypothetical protein
VTRGTETGVDAIAKAEAPLTGDTASFLAFAAALVLAGSAGSIAVTVGGVLGLAGKTLIEQASRKFVEDGVKDAIKQAFHGHVAPKPTSLSDLKQAFKDQIRAQISISQFELAARWSEVNDRLASLSTTELQALVTMPIDLAKVTNILDVVADQTVIAWTNFLAQAKHGAMGARDPWARRPGIPTSGFDPHASDVGAHAANVDPKGLDAHLELHQGAVVEETFGILEIFLTTGSQLLDAPGYGIRLDNAGPEVRKRLRSLGRVRDLKVNKLVRLCSSSNPPTPVESALVTADGRIQRYSRGSNQLVHRDPQMPIGACLDDLVAGHPSEDCHVAREANDRDVTKYVEVAQGLSLELLRD